MSYHERQPERRAGSMSLNLNLQKRTGGNDHALCVEAPVVDLFRGRAILDSSEAAHFEVDDANALT